MITDLKLNSTTLAAYLSGQGSEGTRIHGRVTAVTEQIAGQARRLAPEGEGYKTIVFDDTTTPGRSGAFPRRRLAVMLTHPDPQARQGAHAVLLGCMDAAR